MSTMNTPNVELLDATLHYIETHPENWDQEVWASKNPNKPFVEDSVCGSSYCFAGRAAVISGYAPLFNEDFYGDDAIYFAPLDKAIAARFTTGNAAREDYALISNLAASLLGLPENIADTLFSGGNSIEVLQDYVAQIKEHGTIVNYHDYED